MIFATAVEHTAIEYNSAKIIKQNASYAWLVLICHVKLDYSIQTFKLFERCIILISFDQIYRDCRHSWSLSAFRLDVLKL